MQSCTSTQMQIGLKESFLAKKEEEVTPFWVEENKWGESK